ncbi:MAG: methyltransferase [Patescibacteria group bacterium]|nr:methyltransferase [Patescibacteria group bacterium]
MKTDIPTPLVEAFVLAVKSTNPSNITAFQRELENNLFSDPLQLLFQPAAKTLFPTRLNRKKLNFEQWIESIRDWLDHYQEPGNKPYTENILYAIWMCFARKLKRELEQSRHFGTIPSEGGVLAFVAGTKRCIVIEYVFQEAIAELHPIAVIVEPRSLFDFWGTIDRIQTAAAQNALKKIQSSGHKLVYHRGTLVHVDRRCEPRVFGPTIDTVLLAEALMQHLLINRAEQIQTAVEIGSGNGLLSAELIKNNPHLKSLVAIDSDFSSVACTNKNCSLALNTSNSKANICLVNGKFAPDLLTQKFDLCICNPPYLPLPANNIQASLDRFSDNRRATGGTELMEQLVKQVDRILAPAGCLLLITSSLSLDKVINNIPNDFGCNHLFGENGVRVIFDVDSVVTDAKWLQHLIKECGLKRNAKGYTHNLHPLIIRRSRL